MVPAFGPRTAGVLLLGSIVAWWTALRWWAEAQVGYLDVDALGVAPFAWTVLLVIAGLGLVTGVVPRPADRAANVAVIACFVIVAAALTAVNVAYGADDGISAAGWLVATLSLAQATMFIGAVYRGSEGPARS